MHQQPLMVGVRVFAWGISEGMSLSELHKRW